MATIQGDPISGLPNASTLTGAEILPLVQNGVTDKTTLNDIKTFVNSGNFQSDTYLDWNTKRLAGTLPSGEWVLITDASNTDLGAIIQCTTTSQFSNFGSGGFLDCGFVDIGQDVSSNPNYANIINVTEVAPTYQRGIWGGGAVVNGEIYIWECRNFQVTNSGAVTTDNPSINPAFTEIPRGRSNGFIEVWNKIDYDFVNNIVNFRYDNRNNIVGSQALPRWQFGDPNVRYNICDINSNVVTLNNTGNISNNLYTNCYVNMYGNLGSIDSCKFNYMGANLILNSGVFWGDNYCDNDNGFTFDPTVSYQNKELTNSHSTFDCPTIDVTGLTTLDLSSGGGYCGIFTFSSTNITETITDIINRPFGFNYTIKNASLPNINTPNITTFIGTPLNSIGAYSNKIALPVSTFSLSAQSTENSNNTYSGFITFNDPTRSFSEYINGVNLI